MTLSWTSCNSPLFLSITLIQQFFLIADAWQQRNQCNAGLHVHKSWHIIEVRKPLAHWEKFWVGCYLDVELYKTTPHLCITWIRQKYLPINAWRICKHWEDQRIILPMKGNKWQEEWEWKRKIIGLNSERSWSLIVSTFKLSIVAETGRILPLHRRRDVVISIFHVWQQLDVSPSLMYEKR